MGWRWGSGPTRPGTGSRIIAGMGYRVRVGCDYGKAELVEGFMFIVGFYEHGFEMYFIRLANIHTWIVSHDHSFPLHVPHS